MSSWAVFRPVDHFAAEHAVNECGQLLMCLRFLKVQHMAGVEQLPVQIDVNRAKAAR